MNSKKIISESSIKRLIKDLKDVLTNKNEFENAGIYYKHDEDNVLKGYIMIIGPADTPYHFGFYFFSVKYPQDYPYSPPHITFDTQHEGIRFNPNLYTNGKVCISILNTWKGEQWTSCQTIRSVLFYILNIFGNENPLTNEPGVSIDHKDNINYNKIITFQNLNIAIKKQIDDLNTFNCKKDYFYLFKNDIKNYYNKNIKDINNTLNNLLKLNPESNIIKTSIFSLNYKIDYNSLCNKFENLSINF